MNKEELWQFFWEKKVAHAKPIFKEWIWVARDDFKQMEKYFIREFNLFNPGRSLRSREYFSHIHAVEQDSFVFIHEDHGNIARFFPLGIIHLIFDVIPFFAYMLIKRVSMKNMITCPKIHSEL